MSILSKCFSLSLFLILFLRAAAISLLSRRSTRTRYWIAADTAAQLFTHTRTRSLSLSLSLVSAWWWYFTIALAIEPLIYWFSSTGVRISSRVSARVFEYCILRGRRNAPKSHHWHIHVDSSISIPSQVRLTCLADRVRLRLGLQFSPQRNDSTYETR